MAEKIIIDVDFQTNAKETTNELDDLKTELEGIKEELTNIKDAEKKTSSALGKLSKGFKGMGLAMKALGVGLVIEAFNFLREIMMKNQAVMDGVAVVTETIGIVFNQLTTVVTDVVTAITESTEGFEGIQKVITGLMKIAITPLKLSFLGIVKVMQEAQLAWEQSFFGDNDQATIDELNAKLKVTNANLTEVVDDVKEAGKQIADNLGEALTEMGSAISIAVDVAEEGMKQVSITSALETGKALADAKGNLELIEVLRAKQQMQSQLDAEIQRQIRDDVSKTFEERIEANNELGKILDEQLEKEQFAANEKVRIAELELSTNDTNMALKVAYQQALLEQIDLEERVSGMKSEQLTNEVGLTQELAEAQNQLALARVSDRELELLSLEQDYLAKQELARIAGEEDLVILAQYNQSVLDLNQKFADEDIAIAEKVADAKILEEKTVADTKESIARSVFGSITSLLKEGSDASKVAAIAEIGINTALGFVQGLDIAQKGAKATGPLAPYAFPIFYATQIGAVLQAGKKASQVLGGGKTVTPPSDIGDASVGAIESASSSVAEESLSDLSGIPSLTESFNSDFASGTSNPVQAYVVEQEVTNSQQINTMIQQKATL